MNELAPERVMEEIAAAEGPAFSGGEPRQRTSRTYSSSRLSTSDTAAIDRHGTRWA